MANAWVTGQAFIPTVGTEYEISFGTVNFQNQTGHWTARIRADGILPSQWADLDTGAALDSQLGKYVVLAYRAI